MPAPKPRGKPKYSSTEHGGDRSGMPGDYTIETSLSNVRLVTPREKSQSPLHFRPWPAHDPQEPTVTLLPGRVAAATGQGFEWGDWNRRVPIVKYAGFPVELGGQPCTFHPYHPSELEKEQGNPYRVLFRAANTAFKAGKFGMGPSWDPSWNKFVAKDSQEQYLVAPSIAWYIQGVLYHDGEKDYYLERGAPYGAAKGDDLVVLRLSKQVGDRLIGRDALINKPKKDGSGFLFPDPVGIQHKRKDKTKTSAEIPGWVDPGLLFCLYNPKQYRVTDTPHVTFDGKLAQYQGFEAAVYGSYKLKNGDKVPLKIEGEHYDSLLDKWQFWESDPDTSDPGLLRFPSYEEQCVMIAHAFKPLAQMVEWCWPAQFLTNDVMKILRDGVTVTKPPQDQQFAPGSMASGAGVSAGRGMAAGATTPPRQRAPVVQSNFDDFPDENASGATSAADDEFDSVPEVRPPKKTGKKAATTPAVEPEEEDQFEDLFASSADEPVGEVELEEDEELEGGVEGAEDAEFEDEEAGDEIEAGEGEEFAGAFEDEEDEEEDDEFEPPPVTIVKKKNAAPKTGPAAPPPPGKKAVRPNPPPAAPASGKTGSAPSKKVVKKTTK